MTTNESVVLILGAGASEPYGFPLGIQLRNYICENKHAQLVEKAGYEVAENEVFVETLSRSAYTSVDWFLEDNPHFIEIGKAATAAVLLQFEAPDMLFPPRAPARHWYEMLLNALDSPIGSFPNRKISIVTFNYDRSLEFYLSEVLATRMGSREEAATALARMEIFHVHGSLGEIPCNAAEGVAYGGKDRMEKIRMAAQHIEIISELDGGSAVFELARTRMRAASRIDFLGFGFHPKSVERLEIFNEPWDEARRKRTAVNATSVNIPDWKWKEVTSQLLNRATAAHPRYGDVWTYLSNHHPLS